MRSCSQPLRYDSVLDVHPQIQERLFSRKNMWGCTARLFAQNCDAVLVVIVILAGEAIFVIFELEV